MILADRREPETMRKLCDGTYDLRQMCGNGDYLIKVDCEGVEKKLLVERKTAADFIHTVYQDGRLNDQLEGVDALVFERFYVPKMNPGWWVKLHSALNGVAAHTPVFYTLSSKHTIQQLRIIERKLKDGSYGTFRHSVTLAPLTSKENEDQVRVLIGFPGMGEKKAGDILRHYRTLDNALRNVDNWVGDVRGIGPKTANAAKQVLGREFV